MADIFDLFRKIEKSDKAASTPISHIIVGLGNPGEKYFATRHNAGFLAIDYIAQRANTKIDRAKFKALVGEATIGGVRVLLMKPQTFMNLSGEAVSEAASFYKITPGNIIVLSDDVNLDVGRLRVRKGGSSGGQNGLNNIIDHLGTDKFPRIRVGVGKKPHPDYDLAAWVLGELSDADKKIIFELFGVVYDGVIKLLSGDIDGAMQLCNSAK